MFVSVTREKFSPSMTRSLLQLVIIDRIISLFSHSNNFVKSFIVSYLENNAGGVQSSSLRVCVQPESYKSIDTIHLVGEDE